MSFFTTPSRLLAGATLALAWQASAHAQAPYPDKPIRLVVPFPPGSGTDIVGRLLAQEVSNAWSQPVIVDNRPGASTIVGTEIVANSPPDGYTMVMASNNHAMNPSLFAKKLPFDPQKDFAAVAQVAILPFILVVNPELPVENFAELLALARRKPHEITYASTGNGTPPHVAGEMLKRAANVDLIHIPYKGSAAAVADVVSGQVSMMFINVPSAMSLVRAGKLRALAVGTSRRIDMMPELPTISELGFPGFDVSLWMGLLVPARTPADIVDKLAQETARILNEPTMRAKLEAQGAAPAYRSPAAFSAFIADETKRFSRIVDDIMLRVD
jgi:tripartite-type tricarboxylate transporter receptor subunit TctC